MYKLMIFLKRTDDDSVLQHFLNSTMPRLQKLTGQDTVSAVIEGSALNEEKFTRYCEFVFESADVLNQLLQSPEGKELNKDLASYHNNISIFFANYGV